jgi:RNA polymerase sigma-70 factor (ECF subfamily)
MSRRENNNYSHSRSAAIRGGDEAAFRLFYEERLVYLLSRVERLTGDRDGAWDIVQDAFVKLWRDRERIDPDKPLDGLVAAMAANAACDAHKRRQVHARYHKEQLSTQSGEDHHADAAIIEHETQREMDAIIEAMPPQRRRIYLMSRQEGLTYQEIADRLGISRGTVHRHMSIALDQLRGLLSLLFISVIHPPIWP